MPIITISQDMYSRGEEIAEKVAQNLGYECVGPEIIGNLCKSQGFPLYKIEKALHESPGIFDHLSPKKEQYLAMFRAVFFETMLHDKVVYHGLAGHIFLADIPNVIKVRVTEDLEERVRQGMLRNGLSFKEAKKRIIRKEKERSRWTKQMFDKDNQNPQLYDLYLNLKNISLDMAIAVIVDMAKLSLNGNVMIMKKRLTDMALAAKIEARLLESFPEVRVAADDGDVFIRVQGSILQEESIVKKANKIMTNIEGIRSVRIDVAPSIFVPF